MIRGIRLVVAVAVLLASLEFAQQEDDSRLSPDQLRAVRAAELRENLLD